MTNIFLLLVDMSNLEPNIFLSQGPRRAIDDVLKALLNH